MTAENDKLFEALVTIKQWCLKNYNDGKCDCPCASDTCCKAIECAPKNWEINRREVFL